ncbi:hypothetical protein [Sulfurimonas microaerophilic]|uniref:hypothetical protein n=1 Tax=Sulfurimonas microaerophilic TaxID=3058392 RepID=UPI0027152DA8|nr:hypothetical protein [Sulfurimonas sp. hsl 1-7]
MAFTPNTQAELHNLNIVDGQQYEIRYKNKDYYNGEETIEEGVGTAILNNGNIYFNVVDPYGMDKLVMQVQVIQR